MSRYTTWPSSKAYVNKPNDFVGGQRFGGETSYAEFDDEGSIRVYGEGTCWEDLRFPATAVNPAGAANPMGFDQTNIGFTSSASAIQSIAMIAQMPHSWKMGSAIIPHIHWQATTTNIGDVYWQMEYKWTNHGEVEAAGWELAPAAIGSTDGTIGRHLITSFGEIDGTGKTLSSILTIRISRVGNDALDTYTGLALLKEFDIHYQIDSFGSREEYIK